MFLSKQKSVRVSAPGPDAAGTSPDPALQQAARVAERWRARLVGKVQFQALLLVMGLVGLLAWLYLW